jgi:hypothetical protein
VNKTLKMRPPREVRREVRDYEKEGYNVAGRIQKIEKIFYIFNGK